MSKKYKNGLLNYHLQQSYLLTVWTSLSGFATAAGINVVLHKLFVLKDFDSLAPVHAWRYKRRGHTFSLELLKLCVMQKQVLHSKKTNSALNLPVGSQFDCVKGIVIYQFGPTVNQFKACKESASVVGMFVDYSAKFKKFNLQTQYF